MEAHGVNGQVHFDGNFVTITRRGFLARATVGKGDKRIPIGSISAVQWKPAGLVRGFIQFTLAGGNEVRSRFGRQSVDAASDENSVLFGRSQQAAFEQLRAAVEQALAQRAGFGPPPAYGPPPMPPAPPLPAAGPPRPTDPAGRLRELAGLRDAGLISEQEYAAKRAEILRQL